MSWTGARAFVCVLVCTSFLAGTAGSAVATPNGETTPGPNEATQTVTYRLLPDRPGVVGVTLSYEVGRDVDYLGVSLPSNVRVRPGSKTPGFVVNDDSDWEYVWDGESRTARLTLAANVNQFDRHLGGYSSLDRGSWALFKKPFSAVYRTEDRDVSYFGTTETAAVSRVRFEGGGYSSGRLVYLGPYSTRRIEPNQQSVTIVVPDRTSFDGNWTDVEGSLRFGATSLGDWGNTPETVAIFVAPSDFRPGGQAVGNPERGYSMWVHESSSITYARNVWLHEYVHLHQGFSVGKNSRMAWIVEGSAEYYASLLTYRRGDISSEQFYRAIHDVPRGSRNVTLAAQYNWSRAQYDKGARVLAALDAKIRQETDGERTLSTVFRRMNAHEGQITYADFKRIVGDVAGRPLDGWLDRYALTSALPPFDESLAADETADEDHDGLDAATEAELATNPYLADTDRDGLNDSAEYDLGTDPPRRDTDDDGVSDRIEAVRDTDPTLPDTDGDGTLDGTDIWGSRYSDDTDAGAADEDREAASLDSSVAESPDAGPTPRRYGVERVLYDAGFPSGPTARGVALVVPAVAFLLVTSRLVS